MLKPGPKCVWDKGTKYCSCGHTLNEATRKAWESHARRREEKLKAK